MSKRGKKIDEGWTATHTFTLLSIALGVVLLVGSMFLETVKQEDRIIEADATKPAVEQVVHPRRLMSDAEWLNHLELRRIEEGR